MIKVGSKWFLRCQARYNSWYVVCGLTPMRFAGCRMFFDSKAEALRACKERGYELVDAAGEELRKVDPPTIAACLLMALVGMLGVTASACVTAPAPELAGDVAALERCAFDPTATYKLAGAAGTRETTIADYMPKCAAPEQIHVSCTGNVLTVRDREYTEVWTLEAPELASVNVLAPGIDELYSVTLGRTP